MQTYNTETTELNFKSITNCSTETYPKLMYTAWAQVDPYIELMPYECRIPGNRRTRYPVGCVGVAIRNLPHTIRGMMHYTIMMI